MGSKPSGISGSRISIILGLNPYKTELQLWYELMEETYPGWLLDNGYMPEFKDISNEPAIRIGNIFEEAIIEYVCCGQYRNREKEYTDGNILTCHVDAELMFSDVLIEAKTCNIFSFWSDWGLDGSDAIPDYYYAQVQLQMGLAKKKFCTVPLLIFPNRQTSKMCDWFGALKKPDLVDVVVKMNQLGLLKLYSVEFNDLIFHDIKNKAYNWWEKHIIGKTPPEGKNDREKIIMPVFGEVEPSNDICEAIALYKKTENEINEKIKSNSELKNAILNYMIKNAQKGRSDFVRIKKDKRVLASYNAATGRFSIRGEKDEN